MALNLNNEHGLLGLSLHEPDSATAQRVVYAINLDMRRTVASAVDGGLIEIQGPVSPNERTNFMARIESIDVLPIQGINVYDILRRHKLVLTKAAVDALEARFK